MSCWLDSEAPYAESFVLNGKETNKVGESGEQEPGSSGQIEVEPNN
jgi:hypothetical protein